MLGAAVADDVLGLIILTVVVKVVTGDSVTVGVVASTVLAAARLPGARRASSGILAVPRAARASIAPLLASGTTLTVAALVLILGLAVLADVAQLAFIIGAFMAGLAIGRSDQHERIANDLNSVGGVLIPVFFVLIGVNADLGAMFQPSVLLDAAVLLVIAVAGKLVSAFGAAGTRSDRLLIGLGMIPRGEVGLIFASIGLAQGVLDDELYGALLLVVLLTTVVTPPLLRWRIGGRAAVDVGELDEDVTPEPADGLGRARATAGSCSPDGRRRRASCRVALQAAALRRPRPPVRRAPRRGSATGATSPSRGPPTTRPPCSTCCAAAARAPCACSTSPACSSVACPSSPPRSPAGAPTRASSIPGARCASRPSPASTSCSSTRRAPAIRPARARPGRRRWPRWSLDVLGLDADAGAVRRLLDELAVDGPGAASSTCSQSAAPAPGRGRDLDGYGRAELRQLATHVGTPASARAGVPARRRQHPRTAATATASTSSRALADVLAHPELLGERRRLARRRPPGGGRGAGVEPAAHRPGCGRRPTATC